MAHVLCHHGFAFGNCRVQLARWTNTRSSLGRTPKGLPELTAADQRAKFLAWPRELLREVTKKFGDQPYKLNTEHGVAVITQREYVAELKSDRNSTFPETQVPIRMVW